MPATDRLVAWIHDRPVAHLERDKRGRVWLNYTGDVFDSHQMNSPVLSCSLPLTTKRLDATAFIDGCYPKATTGGGWPNALESSRTTPSGLSPATAATSPVPSSSCRKAAIP